MNNIARRNTKNAGESTLSAGWVETHADCLFNFAIGRVRDADMAQDLVQETFLAAVKSEASFNGKSSERTWLVGILKHKIHDHLRKTCRERKVRVHAMPPSKGEPWDGNADWLPDSAVEMPPPSHRMELNEFRTHLELALTRLPPRIALVFQLYEVEERSNREVCDKLNISESNLWVMLHRGRKQLRDQLGKWWFGGSINPASETTATSS
jgi:RNA polymerase sigma-70 factor (ECF subfamily)